MAYTNDDILNYVNFVTRKENKGQPLTRNNFSLILSTSGGEYYEVLYDKYEQTQEISDSLRRFKIQKSGAQLGFTGTTIDLPTDYAHAGSLYHKKGGTEVRAINIVDDDQFMMKQTSIIEVPSVDYPIARFTTDYIEYLPTTLDQNNFTFDYLRQMTTPVYDYYIDVNGVTQYLAAAAIHVWTTGETDSTGTVRATGQPNYTSLTVELDFEEEDKLKVAYRVLQAVGIPIDEVGAYQYAEQLKNES